MMFRDLRADEVECRIGTVKEGKGVSLLLYKTARVDMDVLDETVGPLNWQKSYCRDNANCIVSIWDESKGQWISKEDTGTESNTEKEKGLASDSFKRACFNFGIGRELYSAPFIWIPGAGKYDKFWVREMEVESKKITKLVIYACDQYGNRVDDEKHLAFEWPRTRKIPHKKAETKEEKPSRADAAKKAYPPREEMESKILSVADGKQFASWLSRQGISNIAEAEDAAVMALYGFYEQKGIM